MKQMITLTVALGLALSVTACQRFSSNRNYAAPLPATPTTPVGQGALQPLDPLATPGVGQVSQEPLPGETQVAAIEPTGAKDVSRSDMAGGWKLVSSNDSCMAFMALTSWSGGYRANTRGCNSVELSSISAWNISGKQVILKNADGQAVATLYAASDVQFNGQTATGAPVSLNR
ncbi:protease inhibitor Inh/omp19 family protein [Roseibium limicola]|uniref:Protease inhibitor Inh/omp19 family protein n=1 Tax=Roseibium limicola TaxID=2816037 RepID=A0A939J7R6_9HYPH|nr:protease inhibitor Inh/omp19 family protein [Roseibium limicola]MBO0346462.1 protease inhibitor Inh/omp19 family protein [Roseibium limicola]